MGCICCASARQKCAATRARRASGREAAKRNCSICVVIRDAERAREVASDGQCKVCLYKDLCGCRGESFSQISGSPEKRAISSRTVSRSRTTSCQSEELVAAEFGATGGESVMVTVVG